MNCPTDRSFFSQNLLQESDGLTAASDVMPRDRRTSQASPGSRLSELLVTGRRLAMLQGHCSSVLAMSSRIFSETVEINLLCAKCAEQFDLKMRQTKSVTCVDINTMQPTRRNSWMPYMCKEIG